MEIYQVQALVKRLVFSQKASESVTDKELTDSWLYLGAYKLKLRQLCFDGKRPVPIRKLYPALNQANRLIDRLYDEMLKRQFNEHYYRCHPSRRNALQPPRWIPFDEKYEGTVAAV